MQPPPIQPPSPLQPLPPGVSFINNLPSAVDVREGELLSLNVTVQYPQGSPTTQFRWYLNGVTLQNTGRITIINRESPDNSTGTSISTLTISDVMRNESGDYIVRAYSSQPADGVISNTSVVTVLRKFIVPALAKEYVVDGVAPL